NLQPNLRTAGCAAFHLTPLGEYATSPPLGRTEGGRADSGRPVAATARHTGRGDHGDVHDHGNDRSAGCPAVARRTVSSPTAGAGADLRRRRTDPCSGVARAADPERSLGARRRSGIGTGQAPSRPARLLSGAPSDLLARSAQPRQSRTAPGR